MNKDERGEFMLKARSNMFRRRGLVILLALAVLAVCVCALWLWFS